MKKVNLKLIITHLLATLFLVLAFRQLVVLYDIELIKTFEVENQVQLLKKLSPERLAYYLLANDLSTLIGILLGTGILLFKTIKKKLSIINFIIVLILAFIITRYKLLITFQNIVYTPLRFLLNSLIYAALLNGILFFIIGIWIQFSNQINNWIKTEF